jgi:hypothetical protein
MKLSPGDVKVVDIPILRHAVYRHVIKPRTFSFLPPINFIYRSPVPSYRYLVDAIINNGAIFEIVVDFEGCQMGDFQSNSTYSAILWETYVNNARGDS